VTGARGHGCDMACETEGDIIAANISAYSGVDVPSR
jgi:hypothetical protein